MSQKAGEYYAGIAATHDFSPMPDILDGIPWYILSPGEGLPINSAILHPDNAQCDELRLNYSAIIRSLSPFLVACADIVKTNTSLERARVNYDTHISGMIARLLIPKSMKTGRLAKICIQAVTPEEVSDSMLISTIPGTTADKAKIAAGNSVLLVTTATVLAGFASSTRYAGFLTTVNRSPASPVTCNGRQLPVKDLAIFMQKAFMG